MNDSASQLNVGPAGACSLRRDKLVSKFCGAPVILC